jgi:hypothetical protein
MKSLLLLALGGIAGVLATVLFFTVDPTFNSNDANGSGGGNITLELSEDALAKIVAQELAKLPAFGDHPQVQVTVGSNGLMTVDIGIGGLGVGLRGSLTLNPNIVDDRLHLDVVEGHLGELAVPQEIAALIEVPINDRLDSLASGVDYRLTAIQTTDRKLGLEIEI